MALLVRAGLTRTARVTASGTVTPGVPMDRRCRPPAAVRLRVCARCFGGPARAAAPYRHHRVPGRARLPGPGPTFSVAAPARGRQRSPAASLAAAGASGSLRLPWVRVTAGPRGTMGHCSDSDGAGIVTLIMIVLLVSSIEPE